MAVVRTFLVVQRSSAPLRNTKSRCAVSDSSPARRRPEHCSCDGVLLALQSATTALSRGINVGGISLSSPPSSSPAKRPSAPAAWASLSNARRLKVPGAHQSSCRLSGCPGFCVSASTRSSDVKTLARLHVCLPAATTRVGPKLLLLAAVLLVTAHLCAPLRVAC